MNRDDNIQSREMVMLTPTLFLVPEVGEEAKEEVSLVSHVGKMDTIHLSVQRKRRTSKKFTSLKRRGGC